MRYSFKDLVDLQTLQSLTDELYALAGIPSSIITMDGEILTGSGWQKICTDFHRQHPQAEKDCIESDTAIRKGLEQGAPFVIYQCPRGLVDASSPIVIDGEHVANVFSGQVFLSPPNEAVETFFREQARRFEFDEAAYMDAFRQIPVLTEEKFRAGLSFLVNLSHLIGDMGLTRMRELSAMAVYRESEEKYRELVENANSIILKWDRKGTIQFLNEYGLNFFGYTPDEIIGQPVVGTIVPEIEKNGRDLVSLKPTISVCVRRIAGKRADLFPGIM